MGRSTLSTCTLTNSKTKWTGEEKHFAFCEIISMEVFLIVFPPRFLFLSMSTPSRFYDQMDIWSFLLLNFPSAFLYVQHSIAQHRFCSCHWIVYMNEKCLYKMLDPHVQCPFYTIPYRIIDIFHLWYEFTSRKMNFIKCLWASQHLWNMQS